MHNHNKVANVLVIGAGAAGLAAGRRLKQAGLNAVVLEAQDRVGGRVLTDYNFAPHPIELGAEWVLGLQSLSWALLPEYKLDGMCETRLTDYYVAINDHLLKPQAFNCLEHGDDLLALDKLDNAAIAWQQSGSRDGSLSDLLDLANMDHSMRAVYRNRIASDFAAEADQLGIYGYLEADNCSYGEGYFRVDQGYSQLMEGLANDLDIRLNTVIKHIQWQHDGVVVRTGTGESFAADHLISTLPLGVLQAGDVCFKPTLPADKQVAIDGLCCGKVIKLIFRFKKAFWPDDMPGIWTTQDSRIWYRPGFDRDNEAPILTAYIGGDDADRLAKVGEQAAVKEGLSQLQKFFNITNISNLLVSVKFIVWADDEFSKLAYSYVPVGGEGLRDKLASSINNVLFFAGEATNRECPSLVHGALQSGYRAANEIITLTQNTG